MGRMGVIEVTKCYAIRPMHIMIMMATVAMGMMFCQSGSVFRAFSMKTIHPGHTISGVKPGYFVQATNSFGKLATCALLFFVLRRLPPT
jgi:hypothetical protein